jgi:hypothetical protein
MDPIMSEVVNVIAARCNVSRDEANDYITANEARIYEQWIAPGIDAIEDAILNQ